MRENQYSWRTLDDYLVNALTPHPSPLAPHIHQLCQSYYLGRGYIANVEIVWIETTTLC
jgi:hypothetical protein